MKKKLLSLESYIQKFHVIIISLIITLMVVPVINAQSSVGSGAYATKKYRNLFAENGHSPDSINLKLEKAFQQLFYGDSAKRLYFVSGKNQNGLLANFRDVYSNDVRSEGMSYAMMIAVQMNKKEEFDALWNWAMTYMYVRKEGHPSKGYFCWSLKPNGTPNFEVAAPDGEEYFAMSLYFAANRWGNGQGIYNYKAYADTILLTMRHHPVVKGRTINEEVKVGPMVNEKYNMILFAPDSGKNHFTDPSYHLPAFYELWAMWGPEPERTFWKAAADTSRAYFRKAQHLKTGMSSDYANFDGTPHPIAWNPHSHHFSWDSWRTMSNWSVDWSWWRKDTMQQVLSNRIQAFFASQGIDKFGSQFELDGKVINPQHRKGLVATAAVASLAATHPIAKDFVEAFWNIPIPEDHGERYWDGSLYLLSFLHCSGNFRIWEPKKVD